MAGTTLEVSGVISGNFGLTINVASNNLPIFAGANTYSGTTNNIGTTNLQLSNSAALQNSTLVSTAGGLRFDTVGAGTNSFILGGLSGAKAYALDGLTTTIPIALSVGNNNANTTYTGAMSNIGSLTKIGSGELTMAGASSFTGGTTISNGTLQIGTGSNAGALSASTTSTNTITDNATLAFSRSDNVIQGSISSPAGIGGCASWVQLGPGNLTFNASNSYTYGGPTIVSGGTLTVNGSLTATSSVNVAGGAMLAGSGSVAATTVSQGGTVLGGFNNAGSLTLASLTYSGTGAAAGFLSAGTTPIVVSGSVIAGAASVVANPTNSILPSDGTYPFLSYTGTDPYHDFTLGTIVVGRTVLSLVDSSSSNLIAISLSTSAFPVWTGKASSDWSLATEPNPKNWQLNTGGGATDYLAGDTVVFDDTATGTTAVSVSSTVLPASTTFNNSILSYTLTGSSGIGGAGSLTKNGSAGLLTIANTNAYTGGTFINGGTLALGTNNGLPVGSRITLGSEHFQRHVRSGRL